MKKVNTWVKCPFCEAKHSLLITKPRPCQATPFTLNCETCKSEFQGWAKKLMGHPNKISFDFSLTHRGSKLKEILAEREANAST